MSIGHHWASAALPQRSISGAAGRVWRRIRRAAEISRRRRLLLQLPDYILKDIGLSRSAIDYVVSYSVDRDASCAAAAVRAGVRPNDYNYFRSD